MRRTLEEMEKRLKYLSDVSFSCYDTQDREDITYLIAEVKRLKAMYENELPEPYAGLGGQPDCYSVPGAVLMAEVERLRGEVKRLQAANEDLSGMCSRCWNA